MANDSKWPSNNSKYRGKRPEASHAADAETSSRARAARVVSNVLQGRSLDAELAQQLPGLSNEDQRFLQALSYGVLREMSLLQWLTQQQLDHPPRKSADIISALICVGLFQIRSMNQPVRAAVHSTVEAARELKLDWAAGLINAVLRRYLRERTQLDARIPKSSTIQHSHPQWLVDQLKADWPATWQSLLAANQQPGPMWLRVNRQQYNRDEYLAQLEAAGIEARPSAHAPDALLLAKPMAVGELPGFAGGAASVQDAAAQIAATLLDCESGQTVLDACAAPGGKTGHLLEITPDLKVLALDNDNARLARVNENLQRLSLTATMQTGDASRPDDWWNGETFDRILLDAPCSGTGVIRRHPDIKWLRRADDIPTLAARQLNILGMLWTLLKPGGKLLYATCSTLQAEGDAVVADFLTQTADACTHTLKVEWGTATQHGRRIQAGQDDMDGFYYSLLIKRSDGIA